MSPSQLINFQNILDDLILRLLDAFQINHDFKEKHPYIPVNTLESMTKRNFFALSQHLRIWQKIWQREKTHYYNLCGTFKSKGSFWLQNFHVQIIDSIVIASLQNKGNYLQFF